MTKLEIFAFLGTLQLETLICAVVVTEAIPVACIGRSKLFRIKTVEFIGLSYEIRPEESTTGSVKKVTTKQLFTTGCYFSDSYDITNSLQRTRKTSGGVMHKTADTRFYWNREMYADLLNAGGNPKWCVPIIQGFVSSSSQMYQQYYLDLILISRRSCYMAGTRFNARGIDDQGNVANFVETEQILHLEDTWMSLVQTRGSVPVFWQQTGVVSAPVQLTRSEESTAPAFMKHFNGLIKAYSRVIVVNLLSNKKLGEVALTNAYQGLMQRHRTELESVVNVYHFDYQAECKHNRHSNLRNLMLQIQDMFSYCGFFAHGKFDILQRGVTRINCLDCLDRTNVVMARFGWEMLRTQFHLCNINLALDYDNLQETDTMMKTFKNMWADNGDMLSKQYTGVGSVSSSVTRTGKKGLKGLFDHGMKTVGRMISAADDSRQESIETVLGRGLRLNDKDSIAQVHKVAVRVCTWNVAGKSPPRNEDLRDWLIDPECPRPELVFVGLQELVPLSAKSVFQGNSQILVQHWNQLILSQLNHESRAQYRWVQSVSMLGCGSSLFAVEELLPYLTAVETDTVKTGFKNRVGNKGAVALRCNIYDTSICFCNCHLTSGLENLETRLNQLVDIHSRAFQNKRKVPPISEHAANVLFGDLNFRLILGNIDVRNYIERGELARLTHFDQLNAVRNESPVLSAYSEGEIRFPPTYKYDLNSTSYDTSKKMRVPAWCDRVLYSGASLALQSYGRSEIFFSDHRPVSASLILSATELDALNLKYTSNKQSLVPNSGQIPSLLDTNDSQSPSSQTVDLLGLNDPSPSSASLI